MQEQPPLLQKPGTQAQQRPPALTRFFRKMDDACNRVESRLNSRIQGALHGTLFDKYLLDPINIFMCDADSRYPEKYDAWLQKRIKKSDALLASAIAGFEKEMKKANPRGYFLIVALDEANKAARLNPVNPEASLFAGKLGIYLAEKEQDQQLRANYYVSAWNSYLSAQVALGGIASARHNDLMEGLREEYGRDKFAELTESLNPDCKNPTIMARIAAGERNIDREYGPRLADLFLREHDLLVKVRGFKGTGGALWGAFFHSIGAIIGSDDLQSANKNLRVLQSMRARFDEIFSHAKPPSREEIRARVLDYWKNAGSRKRKQLIAETKEKLIIGDKAEKKAVTQDVPSNEIIESMVDSGLGYLESRYNQMIEDRRHYLKTALLKVMRRMREDPENPALHELAGEILLWRGQPRLAFAFLKGKEHEGQAYI